jgi:hypothetical protein
MRSCGSNREVEKVEGDEKVERVFAVCKISTIYYSMTSAGNTLKPILILH